MKKIHRFFIDEDLKPAMVVAERSLVHQWTKVLKFHPGEEVELSDGRGHEANYRVADLGKRQVSLERVGEVRKNETEPENHVILYAAVLKKENFDWIIQKTTECGVAEIVPLVTDRTIKKNINLDRAKEIAREAAEQSGRGRIPNIHEPLSLKAALAHAKMNERNYFFDVRTKNRKPKTEDDKFLVYGLRSTAVARVGLFIGPEGGWTEEETALAKGAGCEMTTLGPRVLRGETAAAAAVFLATQQDAPVS